MPCVEPVLAEGDTPEDILRAHVENSGRWAICRADKDALNAAVRSRQ